MLHLLRKRGKGHDPLIERGRGTEIESLPHPKIGSVTGQGTDDEEAAILVHVPGPSPQRGKGDIKIEIGTRIEIETRRTGTRMDIEEIRTVNDPVYPLAEAKTLNPGRTEIPKRMKTMTMGKRSQKPSPCLWKNFWLRRRLKKKLRPSPSSSPKQKERLKHSSGGSRKWRRDRS